MNILKPLSLAILLVGVAGGTQAAFCQDSHPKIDQTTLKGFGGPRVVESPPTNTDNFVYLEKSGNGFADYPINTITITGFKVDDHAITPGQAFGGVFRVDDNHNELDVVAGRAGTKGNVQWLKNKGYALLDAPKDLNFAITGDLILHVDAPPQFYSGDLTCQNIAFAQGFNFPNNDWWMFEKSTGQHDTNNGGINHYHTPRANAPNSANPYPSRPSDLKKNSATQLQICLKYKQRK
jgi:hypothetical protein